MTVATFDLTPDPKVLIALTRTPLSPLDALCELIDNSLDGFAVGALQGNPISSPLVAVLLPSRAELRAGAGVVQISDNGPGMTASDTESAIRAGFSGNNSFDSLGLFGMGFNIATGKMGRTTQLLTARSGAPLMTSVKIDLEQIRRTRSYSVPYESVTKPSAFEHGTQISVADWWPDGDANHGFVSKLVQYGLPSIRREIGRRYATILRRRQVRILINDDECPAYEHCVWSDQRFVERRGQGRIPARIDFNEVVGNQRRCNACTAVVESFQDRCGACGSDRFRTIEERIRGWLGIQRFDDATEYGIDLIRNGRAIRIGEKAAFFEFVDELKRATKDYPIDQPYGRIVGEVHLDHVPVDFLKQDFQRSSSEWARAMTFLRGDSSLQPKAEGANENASPTFRLYQGYRRVRVPGRADLYMGYWDEEEAKPKRVPREKEQEFYELFLERRPGFFDDSEWWKLVEQADQPPPPELTTCPHCNAQNPRDCEICQVCSGVLRGHVCVNPECTAQVAFSAEQCPVCGAAQRLDEEEPWICNICRLRNSADDTICRECGASKEDLDPLSDAVLTAEGVVDESLSRSGFSIRMSDGSSSQPIDVIVYRVARPLQPFGRTERAPVIRHSTLSTVKLFVDPAHPLFRVYRQPIEVAVADEIADQIRAVAPQPTSSSTAYLHTRPAMSARVLEQMLGSRASPEDAFRQDVSDVFGRIKEKFIVAFEGAHRDLYESMDENEKRELAANLLSSRIDIRRLNELVDSGDFIEHVGVGTLQRAVEEFPERVFDGSVWRNSYGSLMQLSEQVAAEQQAALRHRYATLLSDVIDHYHRADTDSALRDRAYASLRYLAAQMG